MKRILLIALVTAVLVSCNPSQAALWEKDKATGYNGGLNRHVKVIDAITGTLIYEHTGKLFIADGSGANDMKLLWTTENKKVDIIGNHFILIAEEQ